MLTRRKAMIIIAAAASLPPPFGRLRSARAQPGDQVITFVKTTSDQLIAIVNRRVSSQDKRLRLQEVINSSVNIDDIARFCLGRFWHIATPDHAGGLGRRHRYRQSENRRPACRGHQFAPDPERGLRLLSGAPPIQRPRPHRGDAPDGRAEPEVMPLP